MHDDDDLDHSHVFDLLNDEEAEDIEGIEKFTLYSVGIDIGSSTTHTIFSRLVLRREGAGLSAKFVVTNRDVLYRSPIMLTPYSSGTAIDTDSVQEFIERSYSEAGFTPDDVDTGAVVITGEALKKENAQPILEYFSEESGRFICASAGPMHEALLAAFGSGAVAISKSNSNTVLDVDMGGGTTKISLIRNGEIAQMVAIEVGARLIAYDDDMTITRVEQPARTILGSLGQTVEVGEKLTDEKRELFAAKMTDILFDAISGGEMDPLTDSLLLTDSLDIDSLADVDHVVFSGGVSEYVYDRTSESYGDVGPWLGKNVRERCQQTLRPGMLVMPAEGIRATVIGAGEYTLQASGSTSYISTHDVLPVRGIQVARAFINKEQTAGRDGGCAGDRRRQVRPSEATVHHGACHVHSRAAGLLVHPALGRVHRQDRGRRAAGSPGLRRRGRGRGQIARGHHPRGVAPGPGRHRDRRHRGGRPGLRGTWASRWARARLSPSPSSRSYSPSARSPDSGSIRGLAPCSSRHSSSDSWAGSSASSSERSYSSAIWWTSRSAGEIPAPPDCWCCSSPSWPSRARSCPSRSRGRLRRSCSSPASVP